MYCVILVVSLVGSLDRPDLAIAEFDQGDYAGWVATGDAFGSSPAAGALPNQMPVGGFLGLGLVNSYRGGDDSTGTLTSPVFRIERKRINFLIGGGRHPGEACMNLLVDGAVVRTETGHNSEYLRGASWDVAEFEGKDAQIVIVDARKGGWGHINVDNIMQSDAEPKAVGEREALLAQADASVAAAAEKVKDDPSRPSFHILPPANWLNDPNGLLYHDGWYHVFYQHNPYGDEWGNMHWGHVRSKDLAHWEHLPIALWPSKSEGEDHVFSGSAWVRKDGTPILFYTSIGDGRAPEQWAAIPEDDQLIKWKKHPLNPILTEAIHGETKIHEWRDPYLFDVNGVVHMVCGGNLNGSKGGEGVVCVYRADNDELTKWTYLGVLFKHPDAEVKNVECPIFFKLDGKWVLITSQGQPVDWFVGDLDEKTMRFTPKTRGKVDYGQVYAPSVLVQGVERPILWGWINGVPGGKGWRHCLTIARELSIDPRGDLLQGIAKAFQESGGTFRRPFPPSSAFLEVGRELRAYGRLPSSSAAVALLLRRVDGGTIQIDLLRSQDRNRTLSLKYDGKTITFGNASMNCRRTAGAGMLAVANIDGAVVELLVVGHGWMTQVADFSLGEPEISAHTEGREKPAGLFLDIIQVPSIWQPEAKP